MERLRHWTFLDGHTTVRERARQADSAKGTRKVPCRHPASCAQQQHPGPLNAPTPPKPASLDAGRQDLRAPADRQQAGGRPAKGAMADQPADHDSVSPAGSQVLVMAEFCVLTLGKSRHLSHLHDQDLSIGQVRSRAAVARTDENSMHPVSAAVEGKDRLPEAACAGSMPAKAAAAAVSCGAKQPPEGPITGRVQSPGKMQRSRPRKRKCSAAGPGPWYHRTRQGAKQCSEQLPLGFSEQPDCRSAAGAPQQGNDNTDVPTPCRQDSTALKTLASIALKM